MNVYVIAIIFFVMNITVEWLVQKRLKVHLRNEKIIKDKLNQYIDKYKEEYQLNDIDLFRLKVLTLFSKLKDEEEKETIRKELKEIVRENNGKAHLIWGYRLSEVLFRVVSTFALILLFTSPANVTMAYIANILIVGLMLWSKKWVLSILFGAFGLWLYPNLASHFLLFIILSTAFRIYKKYRKLQKKEIVQ